VTKKSDLESRTYSQLRRLATQIGIKGRQRMKQAELVAALSARRKPRRSRTPHVAAQPPIQQLTELPAHYGYTRLIMMEIDPYQVHAFWEVTERDQEEAVARLGADNDVIHWVLRFYDVTRSNAQETTFKSCMDVQVDLVPGNWYVNPPAHDRSYYAELGPLSADGRFEAICRSNIVHIPRAKPSAIYEPQWLRVDSDLAPLDPVPEPSYENAGTPGPSTELTIKIIDNAGQRSGALSLRLPSSGESPDLPGLFEGPLQLPSADLWAAAGLGESWQPQPEFSSGPGGSDAIGLSGRSGAGLEQTPRVKSQQGIEVIISGQTLPGQTLCVNGFWVRANPDGTFHTHWLLPTRSE
jgi:hypothetical protein